MSRALALAWFALCFALPAFAQSGGVAIGTSVVRFATLAEARIELAREDEWTATTSEFQRNATALGGPHVSAAAWRAALAQSAHEWSPEAQLRWRTALESIRPKLEALKVALPPTVLLVATDGPDPAPHTRGHTIFLPRVVREIIPDGQLMAHELFHILSRHNPALAERLYALLGFEPAPPLEWPPEWAAARLSNPDAPHHRHLIRVDTPDGPQALMPVLVARRTQLAAGENIFAVVDVRLLAVEPAGTSTRAVRRNGEPLWYPVRAVPAYLQRLGGNTPYTLHPEETAADNFSFLVSGSQVKNPALLQQFEAVLTAPAVRPLTTQP